MKFIECKHRKLFASLAAIIVISGCKANPMKVHTAFLEDKAALMQPTDLVPVNLIWRNTKVNARNYTKARVSPINKQYVLNNTYLESCNIRNWVSTQDKDLNDFTSYFEETLIEHLKEAKAYSSKPGKNVIDIDLAIVKVVPDKPILGAINNLTNLTLFGAMFAPVKMVMMGVTDSPLMASVAVEGVFRDSMNRELIVGAFADRRKSNVAYFDCDSFTSYGNLREIADDWAEEITELFTKHPFATGNKIEGKNRVKFIDF